jgi:hypothetical protein
VLTRFSERTSPRSHAIRVHSCLTASGATAPALGRRSARPAPGSASTSYRRARRSALITTKILTRSGSWSSQARQPCGIRAARTSSNPGTSSSFRPVPPEHTSCETPASRPPASRCSRRRQRRSVPSSLPGQRHGLCLDRRRSGRPRRQTKQRRGRRSAVDYWDERGREVTARLGESYRHPKPRHAASRIH